MKKSKTPPAKFKDDSSVRLSKIGPYELKLTQINRLFVLRGKEIAWPYLHGEEVRFDVSDFVPPQKVVDAIRKVLLKQKEIREKNALDFDEDEAVYTYS